MPESKPEDESLDEVVSNTEPMADDGPESDDSLEPAGEQEAGGDPGDASADDASGGVPASRFKRIPKLFSRVLSTRRRQVFFAVGMIGLVVVSVVAYRWRKPIAEVVTIQEDLSDSSKFDQIIKLIVEGEETRLYLPDFAVDQKMLERLPIEMLVQEKGKAMALKAEADKEERPPGKRTNFDKPAWSDYPRIEAVLADQGVVTDEGLAVLAQLPDLEHLRLRLSPISDDGLKPLLNSDTLWLLNLPHSRLTKEGVESLAQLPKLRQLRLGSPHLGNDCSRRISKLTNLRGLHLIGVPVTDEGVKLICALPHLESLYLDDSAVTDAGWDWVFRNHPELHIHINQRHHDRDPKAHAHVNMQAGAKSAE
ncbi:leucine-rich repeat domain-containing protein [Neorhodopirellula lusitana]|uniref:hypothetical protein n=1 Tax=Neorhodopirellula lusitana TaxID=445327 RepID=UPI00385129F5